MVSSFPNDWAKRTVSAFAALADSRFEDASRLWLQAALHAEREDASEPLRAAAQNNAGIAYLLSADMPKAGVRLAEAERLWSQSRTLVDTAEVPIAGRSSVFHLRLAMEHHEAFAALRRRKHALICTAAAAITKFNARLAHNVADGIRGNAEADQKLIPTLSAAFGPSCVEIMILRDALTGGDGSPSALTFAAYRAKGAHLAEHHAHTSVDADRICADLDCAAQLTALMHPGLVSAPSSDTAVTDEGR